MAINQAMRSKPHLYFKSGAWRVDPTSWNGVTDHWRNTTAYRWAFRKNRVYY